MKMTLEKGANESYQDFKFRLLLDKKKEESDYTWEQIHEALNLGLGIDSIKKGTIFLPEFEEYMISKYEKEIEDVKYKETLEIKGDGTRTSDKLISIAKAEDITEEFLLKAHGFNTNEFELISAKNSIWNVSGGKDPNKTLYSSRISVKTKTVGFNVEKLIEEMKKVIKPSNKSYIKKDSDRLLVIPLVDMHWGIADFEYYEDTLNEIIEIVKSKRWDSIYLPIGNDLLHNDNFKGETANGTAIEKVDLTKAFKEAYSFYELLIQHCLENSNEVVADYICGNHDTSMSWGLYHSLFIRHPQLKGDDSIKNKKLFTWKNVALLNTHGDKGANRLGKTIHKQYGKLIADKSVVEIHTGHLHALKSNDDFGVVFRTLPTKAITDDWHDEQSFIGANKYFSLFEYTPDMLKNTYNV
jgi:hypothetical protein